MKKISVTLHGHPTSVSLEPEFYEELKHIANARNQSVASLIRTIDDSRIETGMSGLSGAIRLFVLKAVKAGHSAHQTER